MGHHEAWSTYFQLNLVIRCFLVSTCRTSTESQMKTKTVNIDTHIVLQEKERYQKKRSQFVVEVSI